MRRGNVVPYQSTHNTGGTIMGANPKTSAVNRYCQAWDADNLFVMGVAVPQNASYNPTGPVGAPTGQRRPSSRISGSRSACAGVI